MSYYPPNDRFIQISERRPAYFSTVDGKPFIPIGVNLPLPTPGDQEALVAVDQQIAALVANGGNYFRLLGGTSLFEASTRDATLNILENLVALARLNRIRAHICLGGGPFDASLLEETYGSPNWRDRVLETYDALAERFIEDDSVFALELWPQIDTMVGAGWDQWAVAVLAEQKEVLPFHMAALSTSAFDATEKRPTLKRAGTLPGNDIAGIGRLLDLDAALGVCKGAVDLLASDAVREVRSMGVHHPVLLLDAAVADSAMFAPGEGVSLLAKDSAGVLLHDYLFAPFFAGAAGPGLMHHTQEYIVRHRLWYHLNRFVTAVKGINPITEDFAATTLNHHRLHIYALRGRTTKLLWCRDGRNNWQTELRDGKPPETLTGQQIDLKTMMGPLGAKSVTAYDPWTNTTTTLKVQGRAATLPPFSRSIVVRVT